MPLASPEMKAELTTRLRRIEGQVRGVERMVQEDRECPEVLQQMMAIRSAVHQASLLLARAYLACVFQEAGQDPADELLDRLMATLGKID
jgi:CsoR family transcriptional regulator, copper-sensing transcriptional repressor